MELGFDWEATAAPVGETKTVSARKHMPDYRVFPSQYANKMTLCSARMPESGHNGNAIGCRYYVESKYKQDGFKRVCMYDKFGEFCDKLTIDDVEIN